MQGESNQVSHDEDEQAHKFELLAAVVLHVLVSKGRAGISAQHVARECERNPANSIEMHEIEAALDILLADGLAQQKNDLFVPTRAAIRAEELSF
jgi:hypothetical protein